VLKKLKLSQLERRKDNSKLIVKLHKQLNLHKKSKKQIKVLLTLNQLFMNLQKKRKLQLNYLLLKLFQFQEKNQLLLKQNQHQDKNKHQRHHKDLLQFYQKQ